MEIKPEHTAVRVALWRALHAEIDEKPLIIHDEIGAKLVGESDWKSRPDMQPDFSKSMRASIVTRARFIEDLVLEKIKQGVYQYIILGAGLDTFAQRNSEILSKIQVYEIDQPGPQAWKQMRLKELGYTNNPNLHFVPVDFESGESWWKKLINSGFDPKKPAVFVSTGVSMYLSKETNLATFTQLSKLPKGSVFACTFMLSLELLPEKERTVMEFVMARAKESGTPFVSLYDPDELVLEVLKSGFTHAEYISAKNLFDRYLASRTDGLSAGQAEAFIVASN